MSLESPVQYWHLLSSMENNIEILELLYRYKEEISDVVLKRLKFNKAKPCNKDHSVTFACAICYRLYNEADRSYDCDKCQEIFDKELFNECDDETYSCERCSSNVCDECFKCDVDYVRVLRYIFQLIHEIDKTKLDKFIKKLNPNNKFIDMEDFDYDQMDYDFLISELYE